MLIHFHSPSSYLYRKLQRFLQENQGNASLPALPVAHQHPGHVKRRHGLPLTEWPTVLRRVVENQEPLRKVADDYGVSYETVRRVVHAAVKWRVSG